MSDELLEQVIADRDRRIDEIDRLTDLEAEYQKKIDRLRKANDELRERVEELMRDRAIADGLPHPWYGPCDGFAAGGGCKECEEVRHYCLEQNYHHITDEQISAAWVYAHSLQPGSEVRISILYALRLLGFERCEGCGGDGRVLADRVPDPATNRVTLTDVTCDCPACHGEGWVVDNRQDTAENDHKTAITGSKLQVTEDE